LGEETGYKVPHIRLGFKGFYIATAQALFVQELLVVFHAGAVVGQLLPMKGILLKKQKFLHQKKASFPVKQWIIVKELVRK